MEKLGARLKNISSFFIFNFLITAFKSGSVCNLHIHRRHDLKLHNTYLISVLQADPHPHEELIAHKPFLPGRFGSKCTKNF